MEIEFGNNKLRNRCGNRKEAVKAWGLENARKILQRIGEIYAADTLADLYKLPQARCHKLKADRERQYAVDVVHPYRLVFEPAGTPESYMEGAEVIASKVTRVRLLEVVNYHD